MYSECLSFVKFSITTKFRVMINLIRKQKNEKMEKMNENVIGFDKLYFI
jgi:hypothetical protein